MIRLEPSRKKDWTTLSALIQDLPEVIRANRVTGTDCYVLEVAVADVSHLERLLDQLLTHGDTTTSLILSTPVAHRVHRQNGKRAGRTAVETRSDPSESGGIVINADSALAPS
jgi:DNA-binding Lrp family transcriptional regulator